MARRYRYRRRYSEKTLLIGILIGGIVAGVLSEMFYRTSFADVSVFFSQTWAYLRAVWEYLIGQVQ